MDIAIPYWIHDRLASDIYISASRWDGILEGNVKALHKLSPEIYQRKQKLL